MVNYVDKNSKSGNGSQNSVSEISAKDYYTRSIGAFNDVRSKNTWNDLLKYLNDGTKNEFVSVRWTQVQKEYVEAERYYAKALRTKGDYLGASQKLNDSMKSSRGLLLWGWYQAYKQKCDNVLAQVDEIYRNSSDSSETINKLNDLQKNVIQDNSEGSLGNLKEKYNVAKKLAEGSGVNLSQYMCECLTDLESKIADIKKKLEDEMQKKQLEKMVQGDIDNMADAVSKAKSAINAADCDDDLKSLEEVKSVYSKIDKTKNLLDTNNKLKNSAMKQQWLTNMSGYRTEIDNAITTKQSLLSSDMDVQKNMIDGKLTELSGQVTVAEGDILKMSDYGIKDNSKIEEVIRSIDSVKEALSMIQKLEELIKQKCIDTAAYKQKIDAYKDRLNAAIKAKYDELDRIVKEKNTKYIQIGAVETQSGNVMIYAAKIKELQEAYEKKFGVKLNITMVDIGEIYTYAGELIRDPDVADKARQIFAVYSKNDLIGAYNKDKSDSTKSFGYPVFAIIKAAADVYDLGEVTINGVDVMISEYIYKKIKDKAIELYNERNSQQQGQ